jgi:hypothetical protein
MLKWRAGIACSLISCDWQQKKLRFLPRTRRPLLLNYRSFFKAGWTRGKADG